MPVLQNAVDPDIASRLQGRAADPFADQVLGLGNARLRIDVDIAVAELAEQKEIAVIGTPLSRAIK